MSAPHPPTGGTAEGRCRWRRSREARPKEPDRAVLVGASRDGVVAPVAVLDGVAGTDRAPARFDGPAALGLLRS